MKYFLYAQNEKIYQEQLQEEYNINEIFKKEKTVEEQTSVTEYNKKSFYTSVINKIKSFSHRK